MATVIQANSAGIDIGASEIYVAVPVDRSDEPVRHFNTFRSLLRHRDNLVKSASSHVQRMQKSLTQMNLQIHNVISDITEEV